MLAIALCFTGYAQEIKFLDDGWFAIDRKYAEKVAMQSDSLREYKKIYGASKEALDGCTQTLSSASDLIDQYIEKLNQHRNNERDYKTIIESKDLQIETLIESRNFLQESMINQAKRAKRKRFWAVGGGVAGGLVVGILSSLLIR